MKTNVSDVAIKFAREAVIEEKKRKGWTNKRIKAYLERLDNAIKKVVDAGK